jgi:soluble lytic murein transglycosylase-like protein
MATTKRGKRIRAVVIATAIFFSGFTTNVIASPQVIEETADPLVVYYDIPVSEPLQDYIYDLCCENNVPMSLIVAMMDKESEFNSQAISKTKDYGLMQINSSNHKWLREKYKVQDFLNPYENVYCGIKIIGEFLEKYGDEHKALMAYNMGEDNAKRCWKKGKTSSSYSRDVMSLYELYETNHNWEVQRLGEQNN